MVDCVFCRNFSGQKCYFVGSFPEKSVILSEVFLEKAIFCRNFFSSSDKKLLFQKVVPTKYPCLELKLLKFAQLEFEMPLGTVPVNLAIFLMKTNVMT